jgi:hypothetical protein
MLFSQYVNVDGILFPCSFNEHTGIPGVEVKSLGDFLGEYWNSGSAANSWRKRLIQNDRECPVYKV